MVCVSLRDSFSRYVANTPPEESLVFLAAESLTTARYDLREMSGALSSAGLLTDRARW